MTGEQVAAALLAGARASARLTDDPPRWAAGAIRLSTELPALAGVLRVAPGQALARAHTLAAYGEVADDELGRLRESTEVSSRMGQLSDLLTSRLETPALVLAGIAHAEIATVAPFGSADGLVARAVERMVLISSGFDPRGVIVTEVGHLRRQADYPGSAARLRLRHRGRGAGLDPARRSGRRRRGRGLAGGTSGGDLSRSAVRCDDRRARLGRRKAPRT